MNYKVTEELLELLKPYCDLKDISIITENRDWRGKPYLSDFVTLEKHHNVGFEVFDNEIRIFYFTDHLHFADYSPELGDDEPNYVERAKEFIVQLFTLPIRHKETFKGKKLISDKYYFVLPDSKEEDDIGGIWYGFFHLFNPFTKKYTETTTWQYDNSKGCFTTSSLRNPDPNAVEVITINKDCYIEIFEKDAVFSFVIMKQEFDDEYAAYYWAPFDDGTASFFDSKEKAIKAAKQVLK